MFIGPKSHTSARYSIRIGERVENHSSSGLIVSTGLGSTGWFRSILTGAAGITSSMLGNQVQTGQEHSFAWDSDYLYFSVREPWPSRYSTAEMVFGKITADSPLVLVSQMPENGVIFSDGMESDFLIFNAGTEATVTIAEKKGHLII